MLDSIRLSFKQTARVVAGFDSRNSFISNTRAEVLGLKIGVQFGDKFAMGISGHLLNERTSHFYKNFTVTSPSGYTETVRAQLKLFYISYFAEYIFYDTKFWELSVPLQLGVGQSKYVYNYNNRDVVRNKHLIVVYEPLISIEHKILKWLSATAKIGYRIMLVNNPNVNENFNYPTYSVGARVSFTELYKMFFPSHTIEKLKH